MGQESSTERVCDKCQRVIVWGTVCTYCELKSQREDKFRKQIHQQMVEMLGEGALERFTFDKFRPYDDTTQKALELAKRFHPKTSNLYLLGITGSGKTHLAAAIALHALESRQSVQFFPSGPSLTRHLRGLDGLEEERRINDIAAADVLVINELGIGKDTEFSIAMAVEIIDRRIMKGKNGLVLTSNLHPAELAAKAGDARLESRIIGLCKIIEAGKKDFRKEHRVG